MELGSLGKGKCSVGAVKRLVIEPCESQSKVLENRKEAERI
jgi:hypothetical protein